MATTCKTLIRISLSSFNRNKSRCKPYQGHSLSSPRPRSSRLGLGFRPLRAASSSSSASEPATTQSEDAVEDLLTKGDQIDRLMKMERRSEPDSGLSNGRWFPYLDVYKAGTVELGSGEVIEAMDPYIMDARKERIRRAVENRSYSVCLVVEGLTDFGNVSAAFRSADALGIQSVHVISCGGKKRCCYV